RPVRPSRTPATRAVAARFRRPGGGYRHGRLGARRAVPGSGSPARVGASEESASSGGEGSAASGSDPNRAGLPAGGTLSEHARGPDEGPAPSSDHARSFL